MTKFQLELILKEWSSALMDGSFVSKADLEILQSRLLDHKDIEEDLLASDSLGG